MSYQTVRLDEYRRVCDEGKRYRDTLEKIIRLDEIADPYSAPQIVKDCGRLARIALGEELP